MSDPGHPNRVDPAPGFVAGQADPAIEAVREPAPVHAATEQAGESRQPRHSPAPTWTLVVATVLGALLLALAVLWVFVLRQSPPLVPVPVPS